MSHGRALSIGPANGIISTPRDATLASKGIGILLRKLLAHVVHTDGSKSPVQAGKRHEIKVRM